MASREERLTQNEARFREINESAQPQRETHGEGRFVCECADRSCLIWVEVPMEIYTEVRRHPRRFIVASGHEVPDLESVIERHPGFFIVEKPEEVAHMVE